MTNYMEYTKGGDILIAPSLDYKHQCVLKCNLCDEYFGKFEQFFSHYMSHYDMESTEEDDNSSESEIMEEQQLYDKSSIDEAGDDMDESVSEDDATISENMSDNGQENYKTIASFNGDSDVDDKNVIAKDLTISLEVPDTSFSNTLEIVQEPLELKELTPNTDDGHLNKDESIDASVAEKKTVDDKSNIEFIKNFMKSKENVTALIAAYKNESHLWDFSLPLKYRKRAKRTVTWKKIATNLKEATNLEMRSNQVAACIIYLRQKYRERKRSGALVAKDSNEILPPWVFKQLHFLNPFVESNPIGLLDIHQDLAPKQTIKVLNILEKCPHLWDTNTIEYYCTNKRVEALTELKNIILEEMELEVEEDTLKNYLNGVRNYFISEKRRKMGFLGGAAVKAIYYDHLQYLYDHVGPFKCYHCGRTILTPMALKAHQSQHDGTIPFECPKCEKEFKLADTFVYHLRRHMGDLNHECKVCGKKFLRALEVTEHMRRHTGDRPFCCEICGSSFGHRTGFGRHMKLHRKKYISFCPYCSKGFITKDAMTMHARTHKDDRDFVCSICGKAFKTKSTLRSHVATHENGNYECDICGKSFKNKINLWQHKRKHRLNSSGKIQTESPSPFDTK